MSPPSVALHSMPPSGICGSVLDRLIRDREGICYDTLSHEILDLTLVKASRGLAAVIFGRMAVRQSIPRDPQALQEYRNLFRKYMNGTNVQWLIPLVLTSGKRQRAGTVSGASSFQRAIWKVTQTIPYGETRSYKWVAERAGYPGACRAAGNALGQNPIPIVIPCHRVITSQGKLGGFSAGWEIKAKLLSLENRHSSGSEEFPNQDGVTTCTKTEPMPQDRCWSF